jgi:hypothetical protein
LLHPQLKRLIIGIFASIYYGLRVESICSARLKAFFKRERPAEQLTDLDKSYLRQDQKGNYRKIYDVGLNFIYVDELKNSLIKLENDPSNFIACNCHFGLFCFACELWSYIEMLKKNCDENSYLLKGISKNGIDYERSISAHQFSREIKRICTYYLKFQFNRDKGKLFFVKI